MSRGKSDDIELSGLCKVWRLVDPGIFVKHAPVCLAAQTAIQLTKMLIEQYGINRAQVSRVLCGVPHLVKVSLVHDCPTTFSEAQFSMPFAISFILVFGALEPKHISDRVLASDDLRRAMAKVEMVESNDLNGADIQPRYPEYARVTIKAADGGVFTGFLGAPVGMPENPVSGEALSDKFHHCVTFTGWSRKKCETALEGLCDIEHSPNLSQLLRGDIK